jgi:hypothetical protein
MPIYDYLSEQLPTKPQNMLSVHTDPTIIPLLEHHIPEMMICEILSFIDQDIAETYCALLTLNQKLPNEHRHVIVSKIINTVFTRTYVPTTYYKIVCSLNDLQEIAYLRKLIRLLFTKTDQLQPGETGITCRIKHYLSHICAIGLYIGYPHCIYHVANSEKSKLMSSIHYENLAIAFLAEGFTYIWISPSIDNEKPALYFQFIGVKRIPTHCDCRRFRQENGIA